MATCVDVMLDAVCGGGGECFWPDDGRIFCQEPSYWFRDGIAYLLQWCVAPSESAAVLLQESFLASLGGAAGAELAAAADLGS
jgi:hypothetical protein